MSTPSQDSISPQLASFSSCEISDALVKLGVKSGGHIPDIEMYSPHSVRVPDAEGVKICGPAFTVKMVEASDKTSPTPSDHFVDAAPRGHVVVISAPRHLKSAVWGGLMSAGAKAHGVLGVVLDGRCRDISEHRSLSFPVFARGHSTLGQGTFSRPSELNVPLTIEPRWEGEGFSFAATEVHPGDVVVADLDGVVCVPRRLVGDVVARCGKGREVDERCMEDIRAGRPIKETFAKWRG
ncbi:RraA-like protein [Cantharellus anzutake]|uniref:RraA-like protein n=1 Tax=Cantharellus anzutake TaxID=1750568 RepID=UPI001903005A|nr:RraA-like protein [Cantharellus anzutake]KAF8331097.1 RraA-like protein [Cantharellus anzutake]